MKKLVLLFAATIVSLTSCSKDDNNNGNDNGNGNGNGNGSKLPKSIITRSIPDNVISIVNYTYDGTKIATTSTGPNNEVVYSYKDNVLSKTESKVNNVILSYQDYTFDKDIKNITSYTLFDNKLIKFLSQDYTYAGNDQTITTKTYDTKGVETLSKEVTVNTFDDKNLVKSVITTTKDDKNNTVVTTLYQYDDKYLPTANVTGKPYSITKGTNNCTSMDQTTVETTEGVADKATTYQQTYKYSYDAAGFPTLSKYTTGGKLSSQDEYNYFQ